MLAMNWKLALIPLAFIPVTGLASGVFYGKISSRFKVADEAEGELTTCAQENLTGVRVVRAFGREKFEIDRFGRKNDRFSSLWVELGRVLSVYWASGVLLVCLQIMAVVVAGTAAAVDGAGRFRRIWHITLPGIKMTVALLAILSLGNVLNAGFDQIFNLYNPLVYSTGDILDTWVYRAGLVNLQFSLATAVGLLKSVVSFVLITLGYWMADKFAGYKLF